MHIIFLPYGKRSEVELLLRDMEAQKHLMPMKKGEEKKNVWVQGVIRVLPFGVYEYIIPKESADSVLNTLDFGCDITSKKQKYTYRVKPLQMALIRKFLRCKKNDKFDTSQRYLWIKENVNIIPIGIREDGEITEGENMQYSGWTHEAL